MARKETLVQLTDDLVEKLDTLARERDVSRSELIRTVLTVFVQREDHEEKVRRDIEGLSKPPQGEDPPEWGDLEKWMEAAARDLGELLEPWE